MGVIEVDEVENEGKIIIPLLEMERILNTSMNWGVFSEDSGFVPKAPHEQAGLL